MYTNLCSTSRGNFLVLTCGLPKNYDDSRGYPHDIKYSAFTSVSLSLPLKMSLCSFPENSLTRLHFNAALQLLYIETYYQSADCNMTAVIDLFQVQMPMLYF